MQVLPAVALSVLLLLSAPTAHAQVADGCQPGQPPTLQNGFRDIGDLLGTETVGTPVDCEHQNPEGAPNDTQQTTTGGTFYYYKFNNLVVFADMQSHHWATAHDGIVTWTGIQPYPPEVGSVLHPWDSLIPAEAPGR